MKKIHKINDLNKSQCFNGPNKLHIRHEEAYTVHYAGVEKQLYAQMKGILLMNQSPLQQWDTVQSSEKQVFTANNSITNNVLFL